MVAGLFRLSTLAGCIGVALLAGCGGDGDSAPAPVVTPVAAQFTGTAATGAALGNAAVAVSNTAGSSPCTEASITTTALGSYTCTLKSGETAPFFIVVTDPTGNNPPMVSIATSTPAAGAPLTVNVTPLTTAIVAQLNGGDALGVVTDKTKYVAATLETIKTNVLAQISSVLTAIGAPAGYDPFTTSITAATADQTGNTADQVLDVLKISRTATNALAFSTLADPTPVVLATATVAGTAVAAPQTNVADLAKAMQLIALSWTQCYALPVAQRVTMVNGDITAVAAACSSAVTDADKPSGAAAFKNNGYTYSQWFYKLLSSDAMTGAKFGVPEVMAFYPADATHARDRANVNIKYVDNAGNPGNQITLVRNFTGSSTTARPSNWWISGNLWDVDLSVRTDIRRTENFAPNTRNNFRNGLSLYIDARSTAPHASAFDSVQVTGPGLPTVGLWYYRASNSSQFTLSTRRDTAPVADIATLVPVCSGCSSFWMSRTLGVAGSDASTYRTNTRFLVGNSVQSNNNSFQWASYDGTDGSYNGQAGSGTRPTKGAVYTFNLYSGANLYKTETRTLLADLVDATQGINMQWHGIGANTRAALDPANAALNGAQTSLLVDWTVNPAAEQVRGLWVSQTDGGYDNATAFGPGSSSVVATPLSGTTFTQLSGTYMADSAPYSGFREVGLNYRILDGSNKQAVYTYNP
ncbi:hypothetical protein [Rhodoferax sp. WC2427]|uniref:hypothetical protein n=1 Tax=Rhodoferax sp. WC2427 TaxID=3234144 RepID=UPI003467121B